MATEEEVRTHPVWKTIEQALALKGEPSLVDTALDAPTFAQVQQILAFVTLAQQRLLSVPAALVSRQSLKQINRALTGSLNEINAFISNKNAGHLSNAYNVLEESGFPGVSLIPVISGGEVGKIADDFAAQTQGILKSALDERDRLRKDRESISGELASLNAQMQKLSEAIAKQNADALNIVQAVQTQYNAKEQEISQAFSSASESRSREHASLLKEAAAAAQKAREELEDRANAVIRDLQADQDRAKGIVKIIGNIGITGNYQKTANSEARLAEVMRGLTIFFFLISIGVGVWALASAHNVDLPLVVARMLFAILILGATVYTSRESARHRTTADRAKRVELELASLGPFMESLPAEKQTELRAKLTELYFGKEAEPHKVKSEVSAKELLGLLKTAIEKAGK